MNGFLEDAKHKRPNKTMVYLKVFCLIGASLSEPHIDEKYMRQSYTANKMKIAKK